MKKLLLVFILSFLVFLNLRIMGVREAHFLLDGCLKAHGFCAIAYGRSAGACCSAGEQQHQVECAIDVYSSDVGREQDGGCCMVHDDMVAPTLDRIVLDFTHLPSCNELTLQQLVELLNNEAQLVAGLIYPMMVDARSYIQQRNDLLCKAVPSVQGLYNKIVDVAAHSDGLNAQYNEHVQQGNSIKLSLSSRDKKLFLHRLYQRIVNVSQKVRKMQYTQAIL